MRLLTFSLLLLSSIAPVQAAFTGFTFSGTWGGNLGLIQAGDPFSGELAWDTTSATNDCPADPAHRFCRGLLSFSLTMPASTGLTIPSIPNSQILFAAALYASVNGAFEGIQVNEKSTVDNNFYIFFGGGSDGSHVSESNADFSQTIFPRTFTSTPIPEPNPDFLIATGLALLGMVVVLRRLSTSIRSVGFLASWNRSAPTASTAQPFLPPSLSEDIPER